MSKAKAARVANEITLRCVELCGALGYSEDELLEKWARNSKILDIFLSSGPLGIGAALYPAIAIATLALAVEYLAKS